jgi:hypothetical protein
MMQRGVPIYTITKKRASEIDCTHTNTRYTKVINRDSAVGQIRRSTNDLGKCSLVCPGFKREVSSMRYKSSGCTM